MAKTEWNGNWNKNGNREYEQHHQAERRVLLLFSFICPTSRLLWYALFIQDIDDKRKTEKVKKKKTIHLIFWSDSMLPLPLRTWWLMSGCRRMYYWVANVDFAHQHTYTHYIIHQSGVIRQTHTQHSSNNIATWSAQYWFNHRSTLCDTCSIFPLLALFRVSFLYTQYTLRTVGLKWTDFFALTPRLYSARMRAICIRLWASIEFFFLRVLNIGRLHKQINANIRIMSTHKIHLI